MLLGVAAYQLAKGVRQTFLEELKTGEMSTGTQTWITWIGTIGHVARAIVFALVGWFLLKAAYEFDAKEAVGLDGALTKILKAALRTMAPRLHRSGSGRLRHLLDQRSPIPQDLTSCGASYVTSRAAVPRRSTRVVSRPGTSTMTTAWHDRHRATVPIADV